MFKRLAAIFTAIVFSATLAGRATIIHGTTQDIGITSVPSGATITIDGTSYGTALVVAKLKRGRAHTVKVELPGYHPYEAVINKDMSGWVFGNIIFGGLIGLAVDAITGGLYDLSPEQIQATRASQIRKI